MSLFQNSVVTKYLNELDSALLDIKFADFKAYFGNTEIQENIRNSKEEQFQEGFLRELFVKIFDYTLNPQPNFNLTTELKNITDSRKVDGAILKNNNAVAVIELKSTDTTDLKAVETQVFGYKNHHPKCVYVITSNFEKLRFYIQNAVNYLEFDLFRLGRDEFALLWLCLAKDNLLNDVPLKIKERSLMQEESVTKQLYSDYSRFRQDLYENLVKNNPHIDKLTLFKKTQKLIDRFLFIFFAEDKQLLPANSIFQIIEKWKDDVDFGDVKPLYNVFKKYFHILNVGRPKSGKRQEIFAYNGGLFLTDEILDNLIIDDIILKEHTLKISGYDFDNEVDVNILGHIFEHSLGEIESVQAEIKGEQVDSHKSKRKKDGIFYTPKYITKYIVENTVGKLCEAKRLELAIVDEEYAKGRKNRRKETIKELDEKLTKYRDWLLSLTILDPACGSGAFLNQALEFLIDEHRKIDELRTQLLGGDIVFSDISTDILEKNIYGVDINEESVEIAKLSLWLRTASKGRRLNTLSNNIKCGNSLMDDPEIAGDKAFNWQNEFPEIFANGGFDVVIGNPPYIKEYTNRKAFDGLHEHPCYQGKMDLWYFFGALALDIIKKEDGLIGYIAPNNWITNSGASNFRNIVLNNGKLAEFIDFGDFKVFESAGIQTMIYIMQRSDDNLNYNLSYSKVLDSKIKHEDAQLFLSRAKDIRFEYFTTAINRTENLDKSINFVNGDLSIIIDKISAKQNFVFDNKEVAQGIVAPQDFLNKTNQELLGESFNENEGIFNLTQMEYEDLNLTIDEKKIVKSFFTTSELGRYFGTSKNRLWVIYTDSSFKNPKTIVPYPNLKNHLDQFEPVITSDNKPYGLHRARDERFFIGEKIISLRKCARPTFTFTDFDCYVSQTYFLIKTERLNQKYLTGLLNSNLIAFWLKYQGKMQGDLYQVDKEPLMNLPLINPTVATQKEVAELVSTIIENTQKKSDYQELLEKSKAENNFDREIQLSKAIEQITTELQQAERKINSVVYELYEIEPLEIATIEKCIN